MTDRQAELVSLGLDKTQVDVCPAAGGSVARYRTTVDDRTIDWLRPATAESLRVGDPLGMGCFPLVPYSNRIREGRFSFADRDITLPLNRPDMSHTIHGHGWQSAWDIEACSDDALTLAYAQAADAWPFPYRARQQFELTDAALTITLAVTNTGDEQMPAGLGLHPYFDRGAGARVTAVVDQVWLTDDEVMPTERVSVPADWPLAGGLDVEAVALDNGFTGWDGEAQIRWPTTGDALSIKADAVFGFLVVFTPPGADFFCVEPVSHCTDAFNMAAAGRDDTGMAVLSPGDTLRGSVTFTPRFE